MSGPATVPETSLLTLSTQVKDPSVTFFDAYKNVPYLELWFGDTGSRLIDWAVPLSLVLAVPVMLLVGVAIERGLIRHFYRRPHADQILVTFGLAIVLQEIVKSHFGANAIPAPAPALLSGTASVGAWLGLGDALSYPRWRLVYFAFSLLVIAAVFAFLRFTTFGMVVRAGMRDRETVGLLGIDIERRFTIVFGIAVLVAGVAGAMYAPILAPPHGWPIERLYERFPRLADRRRQEAVTLSGGEQQMLAVARAVARDVKLLLLDEPYEGLAPVIRRDIEQILEEIKALGLTTIIVEQNAIAALRQPDRAIILDMGEIVFEGSAGDVIDDKELRRQYLAL